MEFNDGDVVYYESYTDDFVTSANQNVELPPDYDWEPQSKGRKIACTLLRPIGYAVSSAYCHFVLHQKLVDERRDVPVRGQGFYVYGNHTQPMGDAFITQVAARPSHAYALADPANLGIPVLGKLLPLFGALPVPSTTRGLARMRKAIHARVSEGAAVFIYPEAHVWPWYTGIRPLPEAAFHFPVADAAASYVMTTTYHEPRRPGKKPRVLTYLDGPIYPDAALTGHRARVNLRDKVQACMEARARTSTYQRVTYLPKPPATQGEEG